MARWSYLAQNLVTKGWVSTDLELRDVEIEDALSGPGGISAAIAPELRSATVNGERILQEWQTAIYAETGGQIRGGGILVHSEADDDTQRWTLECPGFTSYANGMPYDSEWTRWRPDPFDAVREIWSHLQAQPDGNIGLTVSPAKSSILVGEAIPPYRPKAAATALRAPTKGPMPVKTLTETEVEWLTRVEAWEDAYVDAKTIYTAAREKAKSDKERLANAQQEWDSNFKDRKPYTLAWWEEIDCGQEIQRLATEVPFEYRERHYWDAAQNDVIHYLDLGQPMIGTRRHDLRFEVGENLLVIPPPEFDGDNFAQNVQGLGKGDGRKMLRSQVGKRDGRLRRVRSSPYKDVGNSARLRALVDAELKSASSIGTISELVAWDHPNAPLGSWGVGDEVFVRAGGDRWFSTDMWVRVVSTRLRPDEDDRITLTVINTERVS